jgi:hypothetical protein
MTEHINSAIGRIDDNKKYIVGYNYKEDTPPRYITMTGKSIKSRKYNEDIELIAEGKIIWKNDG